MKKIILVLVLTVGAGQLSAQQELLKLNGAQGLIQGAISTTDIDGDGKADIIIAGKAGTGTGAATANGIYFYQGKGDGTFEYLNSESGITGGYHLNFLWEDFNGDGKLDLFNTGRLTARENGYIQKYLNGGGVKLTLDETFPVTTGADAIIRAYGAGSAVADFDGDGLFDYAFVYQAASIPHVIKFQEADSSFTTYTLPITSLGVTSGMQINEPRLTLVDFNSDGLIDIFVSGHIANTAGAGKYTALLINNGDRTFTEKKFLALTAGNNATALFADINGDGLPDLIFSSIASSAPLSYPLIYYRNVGGTDLVVEQSFVDNYQSSCDAISGAIADINNDGYYDFIIAGNDNGTSRTKKTAFYLFNPSTTHFDLEETLTAAIPGMNYAAVAVLDADNDSILDFALSGYTTENLIGVYKNTTFTAKNNAPSAPVSLLESVDESTVTFSWGAATDDKTPVNILTYNISVKNKDTGKYVVYPKADIATGKRQVYEHGNAFLAKTRKLTLPDGNYEWSVQAIDAAYAGGVFAESRSFLIGEPVGSGLAKTAAQDDFKLSAGKGNITVATPSEVDEISLYSTLGRQIGNVSGSSSLTYGQLSAGTYIVVVRAGAQQWVKKIIL